MTSHLPGARPYSVIYQAAKLGDVPYLLKDFEMARRLDAEGTPIGRIYGNSSGALVALAHGIVITARARPDRFTPQAAERAGRFRVLLPHGQEPRHSPPQLARNPVWRLQPRSAQAMAHRAAESLHGP